jgi:membrane-bound inhibitor of C-type lysozyme
MMIRAVALVGLATLLAPPNAAFAQSVNYVCSDGIRLTATFSTPGPTPGSVILVIDGVDANLTLPQVKSADGGRYANDGVEFWIRGRDATFTRGGTKATCRGNS